MSVFLLFAFLYRAAIGSQFVLTFDDVPSIFSPIARTETITRVAPQGSVFFFWGKAPSAELSKHIKLVAERGHYIGNHTFHHYNLEGVSPSLFMNSVEQLQSQFPKKPQVKKWVRLPFLNQSPDPQKALELKRLLQKKGYKLFPVTIDLHDWFLEQHISQNRFNDQQIASLRKLYIKMVVESMDVLDRLAQEMGVTVPHIILLHHNWPTEYFLEDLLKELKALGHQPIDGEMALEQLAKVYDEDGLYSMNVFAQLLFYRKKQPLPLLLCHDQDRIKKSVDAILQPAGNKQ